MPTTIRTHEPRELLALIPFQLGFQPAESAVVVSVRGERSRIGLVARVDLVDLADRVRGPRLARALVGHLVADGARRAVVVLYTDADLQSLDRSGRLPRSVGTACLNHLQDAADHPLGRLDAWAVGSRGYFAIGCTDRSCCPVGGRPLAELQSTRVGAQMVLEGVQVAGSRDEAVRVEPADAAARKSARRARLRWRARGCAATGSAEAHRWRREGLMLWREVFDLAHLGIVSAEAPDAGSARTPAEETAGRAQTRPARFGPCPWQPPEPCVVGRLLAALEDVLVRDSVLLAVVPGADRIADRVVAGDDGADVGAVLRTIIDPVHGRPPDRRRAAAACAVLEHLVAHVPREGHAPALTLLALLAWWEGNGARAGVLVDRALSADPDHRMAVLLDNALRTGMPPGWVRAATA